MAGSGRSQNPPKQKPEQHSSLAPQATPMVVQVAAGAAQRPLTQLPLQHSDGDLHAWASGASASHGVAHTPPAHTPRQQSASVVQGPPRVLQVVGAWTQRRAAVLAFPVQHGPRSLRSPTAEQVPEPGAASH
jgi:hypothetical protein